MTKKPTASERPWTWRDTVADWLNRVHFAVFTLLFIALMLIGVLWQRMFKFVLPGHLGVVYRTLYGGTVTDRTWGEGLHVIPPWDQMTMYEVRLQQKTLDIRVLSDEGLSMGVQVIVRFRPNESMLGYLQRDIGPDYFDRLIRPDIEAHIRRTFGGRPAHELYATVRDVLQEIRQFSIIGRFEKNGHGAVDQPYVLVQDVKLTIIDLPKVVEESIVEKYHQEQLMLAYRYKLERENKEAERKRTEAAGIRDFNRIAGATADIMRWRGLEVASEFAKSPNSKFVIVGGGQNGLPLILNMGDAGGPPAASSAEPAVPVPSGERDSAALAGRPGKKKREQADKKAEVAPTAPATAPAAESSQLLPSPTIPLPAATPPAHAKLETRTAER